MSSFPDISVVRQVVIDAAKRTGLSTFGFHASEAKGDGSVVTEFDHKMQELILTQLTRTWPEYSFLGEEMEHDEQAKVVEYLDFMIEIVDKEVLMGALAKPIEHDPLKILEKI